MLSVDYKNLPLLSEERLKKQRTALLIIAFLLLVGGILRLIIPQASGTVLSILVGVLLLLSGTTLVAGMIANRAQNAWPLIGGILLGEAYLIIGYRFITSPLAGIRGELSSRLFRSLAPNRTIMSTSRWQVPRHE
jgi:uncharacterized membrane protein HdeD (DUF308 family)